jgi:hypothetical protein
VLVSSVVELDALLSGGWEAFRKVSDNHLIDMDQLVTTAGGNQISRSYYNQLSTGVKMCVSGKWSFKVKNKATGKVSCTKFNCDMSSCPDCQYGYYKSLRDRISLGLRSRPVNDLLFAVCTLNVRKDLWNSKRRAKESFKLLKAYWTNLQRYVRREYGLEGFVVVLEVTKMKVAHCNIILQSKGLAEAVRVHQSLPVANKNKPFQWTNLCKRAGFGPECWIDPVRQDDVGKLSYYVTKLVQQQMVHEVAKTRQSPDNNIPRGMKLWHGSRGFVAPKVKSSTGEWEANLQKLSVKDGKEAIAYLEAQLGGTNEDCSEGDSLEGVTFNQLVQLASEAKQSGEAATPTTPATIQKRLPLMWPVSKRQSLEKSIRTLEQRQGGGWGRKRAYGPNKGSKRPYARASRHRY